MVWSNHKPLHFSICWGNVWKNQRQPHSIWGGNQQMAPIFTLFGKCKFQPHIIIRPFPYNKFLSCFAIVEFLVSVKFFFFLWAPFPFNFTHYFTKQCDFQFSPLVIEWKNGKVLSSCNKLIFIFGRLWQTLKEPSWKP